MRPDAVLLQQPGRRTRATLFWMNQSEPKDALSRCNEKTALTFSINHVYAVQRNT